MSGQQLRLRIQTKTGHKVLEGLYLASTVGRLKEAIAAITSIPQQSIKIKQGYPPKVVDLTDETSALSTLPFRSGDTLIVEEDSRVLKQSLPGSSETTTTNSSAPSSVSATTTADERADMLLQKQLEEGASGILTRRVVPADNSCLFTSIHLVMNDGSLDPSAAKDLRGVIANIVSSSPSVYSEAMLGKPNKDYCKWIRDKNSWGGGIELSILSNYFNTEIAVVDTQSGRVDRFGEDKQLEMRVFLIYDGIHYDPLVYESIDQSGSVGTRFSIHNAVIMAHALELASEAKSVRMFTDVEGFSLRCMVCDQPLRGQKEAMEHAKSSGHVNFGEY